MEGWAQSREWETEKLVLEETSTEYIQVHWDNLRIMGLTAGAECCGSTEQQRLHFVGQMEDLMTGKYSGGCAGADIEGGVRGGGRQGGD